MTDTKQLATLQKAASDATAVLWADGPTTGAATGVDMVNTTKTTKWVNITGGTVSQVKVGLPGATINVTGFTATGQQLPVRPGHALNIVHTGAPTLQWFET